MLGTAVRHCKQATPEGKSLDDVSGILGGTGSTGAVTLFSPQNPFDTRAERGPSSFDVTHAFTLSAAQGLHFEHLGLQSDRTQLLTKGWELLSISTITSGSPFTVYSGIQQTGAGTIGADRPDQIGTPDLSSAGSSTRPRDDYFGRGANNASFFSIPIGIAGGTGPNSGRFGTLGRNTFAARHITISILRSSRRLRLATGKAVWSERTCNSAQSYLICLTSSTWGYLRTSSRVQGLAMISKTAGNFAANSVFA